MGNSRHSFKGNRIPFLMYGATLLVFLPVIHWLLRQTISHEQLSHAFIVYILTGALLATRRDLSFKPVWTFSDASLNLLLVSYLILAVSVFTRFNLMVLVALGLSLASLMLFAFGETKKRFVYASVAAFVLFTGLAIFLPVLDWPLRTIAGRGAAFGLGLLGHAAQLGVSERGSEPMLLLLNNGSPFHVAAECNGFGMLSSCLLMALVIVLYSRMSLAGRMGRLAVAVVLAVLFNALRIILIVLAAPSVPQSRYMLMHETIGLVTTYGGLALLYLLLSWRSPKAQKSG